MIGGSMANDILLESMRDAIEWVHYQGEIRSSHIFRMKACELANCYGYLLAETGYDVEPSHFRVPELEIAFLEGKKGKVYALFNR